MIPRESPYIWVTSLSGLLVGEKSCEWAAWFKAHYKDYEKVPSDFDQQSWLIQHTASLRRLREELGATEMKLSVEDQNWFNLHGKAATIGGKPDIIGVDGDRGLIYDVKTGNPRASHRVQVMIYMWAVPRALPQYSVVTFDGRLIYNDHEEEIPADTVDDRFTTALTDLVKRIAAPQPPPKTPSAAECGYCDISATHCDERIHDADVVEGVTDDF